MTATRTPITYKDPFSLTQVPIDAVQPGGAGTPSQTIHQVANTSGAIVDPATDESVQQAVTTLGSILTKLGQTLTVGGSVAVSNQLTGYALDTTLQAIKTALGSPAQAGGAVSVSNLPATQPVSGTVALSNQIVGFALDASLQAILTRLGQTLAVAAPTGAITQSIVSGTSGTLIAANPNRKSLRWMNVGASDFTVAPGASTPTLGQGMVYAATAAGKQGGSETFNEVSMATNAFSYASSGTATIVVWECQ